MAQRAKARLFVTVVDDENFASDEVGQFWFDEADELDEFDHDTTVLEFDECVGDEVRFTGSVVASLLSSGSVRFQGKFILYEGTSCGTTDKEDEVTFERVVGVNRSRTMFLSLPGDGAASADGLLFLSNRVLS